MTARTHDLAAFTALSVIYILIPTQPMPVSTMILAIFANLIGGITPDIDQPTAPIWHNLPVGKYIGKLFDKMLGGHRFLTHSILGVALFGFLVRLLLQFIHPLIPHINIGYVWWAFMIGMISHLVMDSFTKEGVPLFLPIPIKIGIPPIKSWRITTGHWVETFVIFPALLLFLGWFLANHYHHLVYMIHHNIV